MASSAASSPSRCGSYTRGAFKPIRMRAVNGSGLLTPKRQVTSRAIFLRGAPGLSFEWDHRKDQRVIGVVRAETTSQNGGQKRERRGQGDGRRGGGGQGRRSKNESQQEHLEERVVQVSRVSKTVKGGRNISFRAVAVVGNENGRVGVGNRSAKEISVAVTKAVQVARKNMIDVPLSPKTRTFPHRVELSYGAAKVMLRPASQGTGVIAGGAVKVVLELAGVKNCFGKQLGSDNPMNNAKATIEALRSMKTFEEVAEERGVSVPYLLGLSLDRQATWGSVKKEQEAREAALAGGPSAERTEGSSTEPVAASS